jgi:hypothetical protein
MADLYTASGTKVSIGPSTTATTDTAVEFAALSWTDIGLVESIGAFGDQSSTVSGAVIGDARTRKAKGARDAGEMTITVFDGPDDTGQQALVAAEATNNNYAFRLVAPNRLTTGGTDGIEYFRGMVMGKRKNFGGNDNLVRRTFAVGINSPIIEVLPT